ncbi:MAG: hypothetical protein HOV79_23565 [Hamadaea sp.]|nr:hypothetical protein [Hamadaea sp.]
MRLKSTDSRKTSADLRADLVAAVVLLAAAVVVVRGLWAAPATRVLAGNAHDQLLFEWMLQHAAVAVTGFDDPFRSPLMGTPTAANLAGNTSVVLIGVPLAPVTLLFGAGASFAAFVTLALAGTAVAWYLLLRRVIGVGPVAAFAGGAFCGFAPGIVSQANGHPHIAAQFLVPLLVALTLSLGRGSPEPHDQRSRWRPHVLRGVALGLTAGAQILLGEETLFLTALALGVFLTIYLVQRPREVLPRIRPAAVSIAVAAGTALLLTAYPLWVQFAGPDAYHAIPNTIYAADLASFHTYAGGSLAGDPATAARVSANPSEQAAFLGLPLLLVAVAAAAWLWRVVWIRSAALTAVVFCVAALGVNPAWRGTPIGVPGPWRLVDEWPLFRDVIVVRLVLVAIPVIGVLLAVSWQRAATSPIPAVRWLWPAVVILAVLPTLPRGLPAADTPPVPAFISSGQWRDCARPGGTLIAYADTRRGVLPRQQMRWQVAAGLAYASPNGYYISRADDGSGRWGRPLRPLDLAVMKAQETGTPTAADERLRAAARADLGYWRAQCVVVQQQSKHAAAMRETVAGLLGTPPQEGGGVWYWPVR